MVNKKIIIIIAVLVVGLVFIIMFLDSQRSNYPFQNSPRPIKGNPQANLGLVEYSDFQCPYCAQAHQALKKIEEKYKNDLRIEFKHYPLPGHLQAMPAAEASECANDQGKFWEYADQLFINQNNLTKNYLLAYAISINLDSEKFGQCLNSGTNKRIITQDIINGNKLNINGTPAFFLNNEPIDDWRQLDSIIAEKL